MTKSDQKNTSFPRSIIKKKWFPFVVVGGVVLAVIGGKHFLSNKTQQPQYQTTQVQKTTLVAAITSSGQVTTANTTSVTTQASGVISKVLVKEGQVVKAGTPIAKLDFDLEAKQKAQQALASYQNAKNTLAAAQANTYSLQSKLFAANQKFINGAVAGGLATSDPNYIQQDADWLASEATYKNQQAVLAQAQTSVNQAWLSYQQSSDTIYAPISGTVTGLSIQPGAVISATQSNSSTTTTSQGTKVANIVTNGKPAVKVNLTEIDIPKIKIGNKVTVTFDSIADKTFVGQVISIDTVGVVTSGVTTYPVTVQLADQNSEILPNMAATASIITDTKSNVLSVPSSALQTANGQTQVRVMKNGKVEMVTVQTGMTAGTDIEITSGLSEGDTVVTSVIQPTTAKPATTTSPFSALGGGRTGAGGAGGGANRTFRAN
jgi:RND family efflux transporter MFP subunit